MSTSAKVAWLESPGQLVWREEEIAGPEAGQLQCATLVSAISPGTEIAAYKGLPPLRDGAGYPRLQGYCNVALVEQVGSEVEGIAVGDRVLTFSSHRSRFLISQKEVLVRLEPHMDAARIVTAYLFHLGYSAALRGNIRAGHRVTVIGLGALGLTSVAIAARAGAVVTGVTAHAAAAEKAKAIGAQTIVSRKDLPASSSDVVISTTNGWEDWALALRTAAPFSTIAVLGFPGRGEPGSDVNPLESRTFYMKQLSIVAAGMCAPEPDQLGLLRFNERANLAWIVSEIDAGRLDPSPIVSGRYRGEDLEQAYHDLIARKNDAVTFLLDWTI